jgi:hypothetical protein
VLIGRQFSLRSNDMVFEEVRLGIYCTPLLTS